MKILDLSFAIGLCMFSPLHAAGMLDSPENVRATESSPAHLRVEWDDAANNETGYRIWRRAQGDQWRLVGETALNTTHFDDGGMDPETRYEHEVAAFNEAGESPRVATEGAVTARR